MATRAPKKKKELPPTGIAEIDALPALNPCTIHDYVRAVSAYVQQQRGLNTGPKKAAQIRLSNALGRALVHDLKAKLPKLDTYVGERKVAGALRTTNADVSESHPLDGLRLAVELKPVNLAVGRAIWNRFGDLRTFAVNLHLKFPFAVIGGVLVIPIYEETDTKEAKEAEVAEAVAAEKGDSTETEVEPGYGAESVLEESAEPVAATPTTTGPIRRSTTHLIERAVKRLVRAGGRKTEADAAHLLEGIAVVAYNPSTGEIEVDLPPRDSGLRWDEFIDALAKAYESRFEE
jgi:hypothetical protein